MLVSVRFCNCLKINQCWSVHWNVRYSRWENLHNNKTIVLIQTNVSQHIKYGIIMMIIETKTIIMITIIIIIIVVLSIISIMRWNCTEKQQQQQWNSLYVSIAIRYKGRYQILKLVLLCCFDSFCLLCAYLAIVHWRSDQESENNIQ